MNILSILAQAVADSTTVAIKYTTGDGREVQRTIAPKSIRRTNLSRKVTVTGYDYSRDQVRCFRVDRIAKVSPGQVL